jgi:mannose-6-phosphate isomerase-like protein (cupin superfamily)
MHVAILDKARMEEVHSGTVYRQKLFKTEPLPGAHPSAQVDWSRYPDAVPVQTPFDFSWALLKPGMALEPHRHETGEIFVFFEGRGRIRVEGEVREVEAGHAVHIPPNQEHTVENPSDGDLTWLVLMYVPRP